MPKIVDHAAYREQIAKKAVEAFRKLGYYGVDMRNLAKEIGVSKSALYHYFSSKRELFEYCGHMISDFQEEPVEHATIDSAPSRLLEFARELYPEFGGELSLLIDFIRNRTAEDIRNDTALRETINRFRRHVENLTGGAAARESLWMIMGFLLVQLISGESLPWEELEQGLGLLQREGEDE